MERVDEYTPEDKAVDEEAHLQANPRGPIGNGVPVLNSAYPRAKGDDVPEGDEENKLIENFAREQHL
jgi:hypothetical protein